MSRKPSQRNWVGEQVSTKLTDGATPPAAGTLLAAADQYTLDAATNPYVGCARMFDGGESRLLAVMVAPGAVHAVAAITRAWGTVNSLGALAPVGTYNNTSWTTTGGMSSPNYVLTVQAGVDSTLDRTYGFGSAHQEIVVTGTGSVNDAPSVPMDRQYELHSYLHPYVEQMLVTNAAGFSVCVSEQIASLT